MRLMIDTHMVIRFLANDHSEYSAKARNLFERMANDEVTLILDPIVVAECVRVLSGKYYGFGRKEISAWLTKVIEFCEVDEKEILLMALACYGNDEVDFTAAYLATKAERGGDWIATFHSKDFEKMRVTSMRPE